jgi:hypothetical protein
MRTVFFLFLVAAVGILPIPSVGFSSIRQNHVTCNDDGLVSVEAHNQILGPLLDEIAEALKLKIYLYDNSGNDKVTVSVHDADPKEVLLTVLRNRSYCVFFRQDAPVIGVERIDGLVLKERDQRSSSGRGVFSVKQNSSRKDNNRTVLSAGAVSVTGRGGTSREKTSRHGDAEDTETGDGRIISAGNGVNQGESDPDDELESDWESEQYLEEEASGGYEDADDYYAETDENDDYYAENYETDDGYWDDGESYDTGSSLSSSSTDSQIVSLKNQIESLQEQIQSGEAEAWYEKWSEIKGEKYITHPGVTLAQLQEKLNNLQN